MRTRRGTAINPDASADLLTRRSTPSRLRQGAPTPDARRFSPLNARQRALVEAFLGEARPWAMKQARRSYRHLPSELHDQGFDRAGVALCTGAPQSLDRRSLYGELARHLDDELRRIHVGWCLNQAQTPVEAPPGEAGPLQPPVAAFIEDGLGGLERAVLQLELGAGRDTSTARAALRLGPRQYARHRELGLGKLRGAITGALRGRVCDQHLEFVTLAATGDRGAAERLASGPHRCRACAREATGLRRMLQNRLALAPWPLAIKPASLLVAKLGAAGAALAGKGTGSGFAGASLAGTASGAKIVAGVVAAAAVASGGIAAVEPEPPLKRAVQAASPAPAGATAASTTAAASTAAQPAAKTASSSASARRTAQKRRAASRKRKASSTAAATPAATAQAQTQAPAANEAPAATKPQPTDAVRETVDGVKKTVDDLTGRISPALPKVDEIAPGLNETVDGVTGAVDDLLTP